MASGRNLGGGCLPKATQLRRADGVAEDARDARDKAHECGDGYKGQPGMPVYLPLTFGRAASQIDPVSSLRQWTPERDVKELPQRAAPSGCSRLAPRHR